MQQYLYNTPQILNDNIFLQYGGLTGTSSSIQRQIAYALAEEQMVEYLSSYLTPTVVTGTFFWKGRNPLELDYGWVRRVLSVSFGDVGNSCTLTPNEACGYLRNAQYGYLDVSRLVNCGGCGGFIGKAPYQITVAYETGLETGTYTSASVLQSLVLASQINLNELDVSLSNESMADVGVESFMNQRYSEKRKELRNLTFGNSPVANRVARLVRKYRARPSMGLR